MNEEQEQGPPASASGHAADEEASEAERQPWWLKDVKSTAIVLCKDGSTVLRPVKASSDTIPSVGGGVHRVEAYARHWLAEKIPAGWLHVYVQDDPEPITHRAPKGYDKRSIEMMTGNYNLHLLGGGLKQKGAGFRLNPKILLLGLGVVVLAAAGFWVYSIRYGG